MTDPQPDSGKLILWDLSNPGEPRGLTSELLYDDEFKRALSAVRAADWPVRTDKYVIEPEAPVRVELRDPMGGVLASFDGTAQGPAQPQSGHLVVSDISDPEHPREVGREYYLRQEFPPVLDALRRGDWPVSAEVYALAPLTPVRVALHDPTSGVLAQFDTTAESSWAPPKPSVFEGYASKTGAGIYRLNEGPNSLTIEIAEGVAKSDPYTAIPVIRVDTNYKPDRPGHHPVMLTPVDALKAAEALVEKVLNAFGRNYGPDLARMQLKALQELDSTVWELRGSLLADLERPPGSNVTASHYGKERADEVKSGG